MMDTHVAKANSDDHVYFSSGVNLFSPLNKTYSSRFLILNLTFGAGLGLKHSLTYNIDGKYEGAIPLVAKNPNELHVINPTSGILELPELSEGSHCLTIYVVSGIYDYHGANPPGAPFKPTFPGSADYVASWSHSVYFYIDSGERTPGSTPPKTSDLPPENKTYKLTLSIENKTYTTPDVPLNFTCDENIAGISYSLDGKDNVTIVSNTTLIGLSIGTHSLAIYGWDDDGNIVASQTVNFDVGDITSTSPEPSATFPTELVSSASAAIVTVATVALLVYLKKRKPASSKQPASFSL
jgi:hypothetical protein